MNINYGVNDAIEGERISCEYRKCGKEHLGSGTGKHRKCRRILYAAFCVIERPIRIKR